MLMRHFTLKIVIRALLLSLVTFSTIHNAKESQAEEKATNEFKIGIIMALTGEWANLADGARKAAALAREKLPPELNARVRLLIEDDQLSPAKAVSAFQKLKNLDRVNAIITWSSGTSKAVAPLAEQSQLPMIAIASDPTVSQAKKYVFSLWVTPESQSMLLQKEALRRGYARIARITTVHDGTFACRNAFDQENKKQIEVALDEEYQVTEKDFRTYITKLKSLKNVDAILALLNPGQLGPFAKQAREAGIKLPIFGYEMFEDSTEIQIADGALEGAWFVTSGDSDRTFLDAFHATYPGAATLTASNVFDAIMLFTTLGDGETTPSEMVKQLRTLKDYRGASGLFSATGDNRFSLPATLKQVSKDQIVPL